MTADRAGVTKGVTTDVSSRYKHHPISTDLVVSDDDCGDVNGGGVGSNVVGGNIVGDGSGGGGGSSGGGGGFVEGSEGGGGEGDGDVDVGSRSMDADFLFRCRICWKGFKHPMSLTLHKDLHAGQTKCPICKRIFSRSYDMKAHLMRIHANAKLDFRH
ncbi:hypothetical protein M0804_004676 [Polistes exclamans]|nr:hypothetical protein M0804_004676 [Polistes exclamans]